MRCRIFNDGPAVVVEFSGNGNTFYVSLETAAAREFMVALEQKVKAAEEIEQAPRIARDSAILMRSGAPFTLSNEPRILSEAAKAAAWDSDLRRYMPGGVKSEELVGTPTVSHAKKARVQ